MIMAENTTATIDGQDYQVRHIPAPESRFVIYGVFDESDQEISRAARSDVAIANARINILSCKPHHELTFDEFSEIALIIMVRAGQGKSGNATSGKIRYLVDDLFSWQDNLFAIRAEANRCYEKAGYAKQHADGDPDVLPRDKWVSQFMDSVLTCHESCDVVTTSATEIGRPFILVNTRSLAASLKKDNLLRLGYDHYAPLPEQTSPVMKQRG